MSGFLRLPDGSRIAVHDGLLIGRIKPCEVILDDVKVSRRHARLIVEGGVVEIEDLGSRNGVLLNGKRVTRRMVRDGDELRIGTTSIHFAGGATVAPPPQPAGEDLLAGVEEHEVSETVEAPPPSPPPPSPPPSSRAAPVEEVEENDPDVDVIEFVDEVVTVRQAPQVEKPAALRKKRGPAKKSASAAGRNEHGVLQFSAQRDRRGALGQDLGQLGGAPKLLLILAGLVVAAGVGWLVMMFTS